MAALSCKDTTPQSFADAHRSSAVGPIVTQPIYENARLGRKVNFAPVKIMLGGKSLKNLCTVYLSPEDGQTSCKVWLTSIERRRCSKEAKTRNPVKFAGVPQTPKPISAVSGPTFTIL